MMRPKQLPTPTEAFCPLPPHKTPLCCGPILATTFGPLALVSANSQIRLKADLTVSVLCSMNIEPFGTFACLCVFPAEKRLFTCK
jgi:hypothetical protein